MIRSKSWILFILCFIQLPAFASQIELPPEELAKETVLPVFDRPGIVRMRNVQTAKRYEMGLNFGWLMSEPIFNTTRYGVSGYYHTNEESAWGFQFYANSSELSTYSKQLKTFDLDFSRAPKPEFMLHGDYNSKLFYGKLSVAKNSVVNTHLMGLLSAGVTKYTHKMLPGASVGLGYKVYFNSNLSLRTDLRLLVHQAPIPFKRGALGAANPVPDENSFKERIHYTNVLDLGLHYLF